MKTLPHLSLESFGELPMDCNFVLRVEVEYNGDLYSANQVILMEQSKQSRGLVCIHAAQQLCGQANVLISAGATAARAKLIRQSEISENG